MNQKDEIEMKKTKDQTIKLRTKNIILPKKSFQLFCVN